MICTSYYHSYDMLTTLVIGGEYVTVLSAKGVGLEEVLEEVFEVKEVKDRKFVLISTAMLEMGEWDFFVSNECCTIVME